MKAKMNEKDSGRTVLCCVLIMAVFLIGLLSVNAYAGEETRSDANPEEWEFVVQLYGWMATIEGTDATGHDFEFDFDTILENLDFTFMGVFGARKNRWTLMTEVIYLDLEDTSNDNINSLLKLTSKGMTNWVINPFVSYEIFGSQKGSFQVLTGARYLDIEVDIELKTRPPLDPEKNDFSSSGHVWDGIVGIRGFYNLTERWFVPYRLDIGTGDSDFTWSAFGGLGYKFDSYKLLFVYRHMDWEFEDDEVLQDLQVSGPAIGAIFVF
jgi:hypothetical protein